MAKYRSSQDFAATYASNKQGVGISIENYVHLKTETTPGTFNPPGVGSQGNSVSGTTPSIDISASSNSKLRVAVDGNAAVAVTLVPTAKTSGALIAAELETKINTALSAAGYDARVWVEYTAGVYRVWSQKMGTTSTVVITNGATVDIATELKLGVANTGTEVAGTVGGDYLWMTKASLKMSQAFEPSQHRSGRQATNIIKKKKMADGEIELYLNVATGGTPSVDAATSALLEGVLGRRIDTGSTEVKFDSTQAPVKYATVVQGNNVIGRYFNGVYPKSLTISLPGDGEAKMTVPVKARDGKYSGIAKVLSLVTASVTVPVQTGESRRFDVNTRVMAVDTDGRTVLYGQDGSLTVASRTDGSDEVVLSSAVTLSANAFLVPWLPHCFDQVGTDNPVTGLQGSVSFDGGSTTVEEVRSAEISFDHKNDDQDGWYGADTNMGFVLANQAEIKVKVELLLTSEQVSKIIDAKEFTTFNLQVVCGPATGRRIQFDLPKVYFSVPPVEIPDNGPVVLSLEGTAVQSESGALDAFSMKYL